MGGSGPDSAGTPRTPSRVRNARLALGMSQAALAAATRLSRQSIGAIEAGRATPAVDVALRIAASLESSVEELFSAPRAEAPLVTEATSSSPTERVALAQIAGRWLSYGLDGEATWTAADGLLSQAGEALFTTWDQRIRRQRAPMRRRDRARLGELDRLLAGLHPSVFADRAGRPVVAGRRHPRAQLGRWSARGRRFARAREARERNERC